MVEHYSYHSRYYRNLPKTTPTKRYPHPCQTLRFHQMHLFRHLRPSTLYPTNDNPVSSSQDIPATVSLSSSGQSSPLRLHLPLDSPPFHTSQQSLPAWVSSIRILLQDRAVPANKLQQQQMSAAPITSEKMHRDLVEWSARVGSIERELRALLRELMGEGIDLAGALVAIQEEEDVLVVERLWMR
jgi:hypothetical protein